MIIKDNVFVVTGAASGLGMETARSIAAQGGRVVLADVNEGQGAGLAGEIGPAALFVRTDVTDEASASATIEAATAFGPLRGLINCAGIAPAAKVVGRDGPHPLDMFARVISVNLVGAFNMMRLAAASIAKSAPTETGERGVIVNTASVAAFEGQMGQAAYAASKGGIVSLTLPAARDMAKLGIRVMAIAPGIMETPMLMGLPRDVQESLGRTVPFPARLGRTAEFAALVRHIIENPYLNGEVIRLDGALRMNAV
ncbi:short-chain dehydrogenase/reductase SDR [Rhodomicrobium vannielii ATCC 17100]|uniref:Short-chain dehydrogenase/reductase SDR n=1 Tax=Rhodomicrobium vannielii (strain ATCC 17100 / DSM 162 / LMG 4299 / NCIMB 10020 / ATH 3.1.1) TaxID=648757 RepID=E3I3E1_RHOVT|nr:SDR family NAD(P)-dependent oxidoreductase [Rhodomicrobium vannielii]ADP72589.1 short-chain dehydrogenase/reductase SDR [Rhodomicrobium vannielii ATCC 17100]